MPTIGHHFKDSGIHFSLHRIPIYWECVIKFAISIPQESTSIRSFSEDCILRYCHTWSFFQKAISKFYLIDTRRDKQSYSHKCHYKPFTKMFHHIIHKALESKFQSNIKHTCQRIIRARTLTRFRVSPFESGNSNQIISIYI